MRLALGASAALLLFGLTFAVSLGACAPAADDEHAQNEAPILNGTTSSRPEVVMLVKNDTQSCSGALIAPDVVLTAAHCVDTPGTESVLVGFSMRSADSNQKLSTLDAGVYKRIRITDTALMPGFSDNGVCPMIGADVALLRLEEGVQGVEYARLAEESPPVGQECVVVGYGRHNADEDAATVENQAREWSYNEQRAARVRVSAKDSADAFSAQGIDGAHSRGDSGGPIFCGNAVAGVVSCSPDRTKSVLELRKTYGDLQPARAFIADTMQRWRDGSDAGVDADTSATDAEAGATDAAP